MSKFLSATTLESGLPPCVREEIGSSPSSGHCTVTERNSSDESEDMMSDTELPRNTLSDDEETKLQEIDGKITVKMKEIASLHKERVNISRKILGKKICDGEGGGSKKKQITAVAQEGTAHRAGPHFP